MPSKVRTKKGFRSLVAARISRPASELASSDNKTQMKISHPKYLKVLATIFFVIWILIGLFMLLFIYGNIKRGAFKGLLSNAPAQQQAPQQTEAPTETAIPGVGKVNISCVQALGNETIQKIVTSGTKDLTDDEKSKFEPCIVEKEEATPASSPAQKP